MAIEITYRRTSRLSMRIVKNGDVHVSVPVGTKAQAGEALGRLDAIINPIYGHILSTLA